ncbi:MAG: FkbM family methyltransferase [Gammaproteobacteria bacterium]|nr:FkbM family methyltransferase [Gammaproteobacteria bacterium]
MYNKLHAILRVLSDWRALHALLTWPKFSLTSYFMVRDLACQGIRPVTILDVGANVGQFAVAAARFYPQARIYSFEPVPDCIAALRSNTAQLANVTVIALALGEVEGQAAMHVNRHRHSSSLLPMTQQHLHAFPDAQEEGIESIRVSTLDEQTAALTLSHPCLLKLDVQGFERQVLAGGRQTLQQVDYIIVEASLKPLYQGEMLFMELIEFMRQFGFEFQRPLDWLKSPQTGEVLQMDALFVRQPANR